MATRQAESVYRIVDVVGESTTPWEEAGRRAVETAATSIGDLRVAEVVKMDMKVEEGKGHGVSNPGSTVVQVRNVDRLWAPTPGRRSESEPPHVLRPGSSAPRPSAQGDRLCAEDRIDLERAQAGGREPKVFGSNWHGILVTGKFAAPGQKTNQAQNAGRQVARARYDADPRTDDVGRRRAYQSVWVQPSGTDAGRRWL